MGILRRLLGNHDGRAKALADLRERGVVGLLTWTGNRAWDERLNRTFVLPSGQHLLAAEPGSGIARTLALLLDQPVDAAVALGTLALIEANDDVHTWDLSDLLARAESDEQAAADLYELELHVRTRALAAVEAEFPEREDEWPEPSGQRERP